MWSHDKDDPFSHIGTVTEAKETDTGLVVKAQLDLENPKAAQVHRLLKGGRVKEFSFAFSYDLQDVNPAKRDGVEVRELKRLKLYEVGPTLVGANPATELVGVKSLDSEKAEEHEADSDASQDSESSNGKVEKAEEQETPDWDAAKKLMSDASEILEQLSDIITRNAAEDSDEKSDDDDGDEASRSQTDDDETEGKSSEVSADRSAEEEQKQLAEFYSAFLQGETDEDVEGTTH